MTETTQNSLTTLEESASGARLWNTPSTSKVSHDVPSVERTCQSSSTFPSHCPTSELDSVVLLDSLSTYASCCDDNDDKSDVSSVSWGESFVPRRSIFCSYWKAKGCDPGSLTLGSDDNSGKTYDSQPGPKITHERARCAQEDHHPIPTSVQGRVPTPRRRIFAGTYRAAPEVSLVSSIPSCLLDDSSASPTRKTRPTSSCMSHGSRRSCASDCSVSFNSEVEVFVFTPPTEQWASKGWGDYFA